MKKIINSFAFTFVFLLSAVCASAQGVYIYKNGEKQVINAADIDSLVFFDDGNTSGSQTSFEMPSAEFGASLDELFNSAQNNGFSVTKNGATQLNLSKIVNGVTYNWVYNFDDMGTYKYSKCKLPEGKVNDFESFITSKGFAEQPDASKNSDVKVYLNNEAKTVIFVNIEDGAAEYYYGPYDESSTSWTRISTLSDPKTSTWMPYYGRYATVELMQLFEKRMKHELNTTLSKIDKGVYVYNTGDPKWIAVKYWFDVKTKSKLEEASILVDKNNIPTPAEVTAYLKTMGYRYTGLTNSDKDVIYYSDKLKSACYVLMTKPEGAATFTPQMHYAYNDLDGQVPPLTVDFPMPIIEFGKKTIDEIMVEYRKLPYFKSEEPNEIGKVINTTSDDFPKIILIEDGGKYAAVIVVTFDKLVIRSPYLTDMLTNKGYEYRPDASVLPTYVDFKNDVMAQFDINDLYQYGWFSVSFMPNEVKP